MNATPLTANIPGGNGVRKEHCRYCGDDGWVVVDRGNAPRTDEDFDALSKLRRDNPHLRYHVYGDALAPCPFCEQGHANEYSGYYGTEGWWQGRDPADFGVVEHPPYEPMPAGENLRRIRDLTERLAPVGRNMVSTRK